MNPLFTNILNTEQHLIIFLLFFIAIGIYVYTHIRDYESYTKDRMNTKKNTYKDLYLNLLKFII